jgi:hypothetical protein
MKLPKNGLAVHGDHQGSRTRLALRGRRMICARVATRTRRGGVAERLKAHAWKVCMRETVSRVRIPPPPPKVTPSHCFITVYVLSIGVARKPRRHVSGRRGTIETRWSRAETADSFSRAFRSRPLVNLAHVRLENSHAHRAGPAVRNLATSVPRCDKRHSVRVNEPVRREGWKSGEPPCSRRFHAIPPKPWFKPLSLCGRFIESPTRETTAALSRQRASLPR